MATVYGVNETLRRAVPTSKIPAGEMHGKVHVIYDSYAYATNSTLNDVIKLGFIPKGARVLNAVVKTNDWGTAGKIDLGWAASAELDSSGSAVEAANTTGFLSAQSVQSTGGNGLTLDNGPAVDGVAPPAGIFKSFSAECQLQVTVNEASNVGTGATVAVAIYYVLD